jgi:hypothetical protein
MSWSGLEAFEKKKDEFIREGEEPDCARLGELLSEVFS